MNEYNATNISENYEVKYSNLDNNKIQQKNIAEHNVANRKSLDNIEIEKMNNTNIRQWYTIPNDYTPIKSLNVSSSTPRKIYEHNNNG